VAKSTGFAWVNKMLLSVQNAHSLSISSGMPVWLQDHVYLFFKVKDLCSLFCVVLPKQDSVSSIDIQLAALWTCTSHCRRSNISHHMDFCQSQSASTCTTYNDMNLDIGGQQTFMYGHEVMGYLRPVKASGTS